MANISNDDFDLLSPQMQEHANFVIRLTLAEYAIMSFLSLTSLFLFARFYWVSMSRPNRLRLSIQFQINIVVWFCYMTTSFVYATPFLVFWRGQGSEFNLFSLRLRGALNFAAMCITPVSTIFITGSRLYSLTFSSFGRGSNKRIYLHGLTVLVLAVLFTAIGRTSFVRSIRLGKTVTTCITFGCLLPGKIQDMILLKMVFSWMNLVLGSAFLLVYYRFSQQVVKQERKKNQIVLLLMITELCFNVVPSFLNMLFGNIVMPFTSGNLGPILAVAHTTDGFITALVYWFTWRERNTQKVRIFQSKETQKKTNKQLNQISTISNL